jgi:phospholipase C
VFPIVAQLIARLRHDEDNPTHALDGWLLLVIDREPSATVKDLSLSCEMRLGPKRKGPELSPDQLVRWVRDAMDRGMIQARTIDPAGPPTWSLTDVGRQRQKTIGGFGARAGGVLAWLTRMSSVWASAAGRLEQEGAILTGKAPPRRAGLPKILESPGDRASITDEEARANLQRVKHIVVLMMENRSFDHMLGYLDLIDGQDEVRGLSHAKAITYEGRAYMPQYLLGSAFPKSMDPPHGQREIHRQLHDGLMDGFIESFARENDVANPERVMGYYSYRELPVYDYFAHNFVLCDRWFSSVPSATWPNRLYALTGSCDPDREGLFDGGEFLYDRESFVRLLEDNNTADTWRWYSWDPGTLRLVDGLYRLSPEHAYHHEHFRRVAQHAIEPVARGTDGEVEIALGSGLLEDAANGDLPRVAWIDPNFVDLSILDANSNDDHPPSDVRAGQELVMLVFRALAESPCWKDTMLVVTYDEHGGFYDHEPPEAPPEDAPQFPTYGVRVPAFVVSPFVEPCTVSHRTFDHTSIVRTILERFGIEGAVEKMAEKAPRVADATHLGRLLTRDPAEDVGPPDYARVNAMLDGWRHSRADRRSAASPEIAVRSRADARWEPPAVRGFPAEFLDAARTLRASGLPAGHP